MNSTKKSDKSACEQHDGADHRCFGSIAQVSLAAVDVTLAHRQRRVDVFAGVLVACCFRGTTFAESFVTHIPNFSINIHLATAVLTGNTGRLFFVSSTVIPTFNGSTCITLQAVSCKKGTEPNGIVVVVFLNGIVFLLLVCVTMSVFAAIENQLVFQWPHGLKLESQLPSLCSPPPY